MLKALKSRNYPQNSFQQKKQTREIPSCIKQPIQLGPTQPPLPMPFPAVSGQMICDTTCQAFNSEFTRHWNLPTNRSPFFTETRPQNWMETCVIIVYGRISHHFRILSK